MKKEKPTIIEVDEDIDFDEEIDEVEQTNVAKEEPKKKGKSSVVIDKELRKVIVDIVNEETQDIRDEQAKMSKRINKIAASTEANQKMNETLKKQNEVMMKAMARLGDDNVSKAIDADSESTEQPVDVKEEKGILGKTLGAIGNVAHGIIDTAAFVLESTVDLVTLGNAKK